MASDPFPAMTFGLICFLFICPAGWLFLQVLQKDIEGSRAAIIYAPLLVCWVIVGSTFNGPLVWMAYLFGALAIAWCIWVPYKIIVANQQLDQQLNDEQVQTWTGWLEKHPEDSRTRFQLADHYRARGQMEEAYRQYRMILAYEPDNYHAQRDAAEVEQVLTARGLPLPAVEAPTPAAPPPPAESPRLLELRQALQGRPGDAALLASLGEELARLGRRPEALEAYRKALWLEPENEGFRTQAEALTPRPA